MSAIKSFGQVSTGGLVVTTPIVAKGTVTQATSITTAVTVNSAASVITTVSSTLAAAGTASFTVNNSTVKSTSVVHATITNYSGTTGIPYVRVNSVSAGTFTIVLRNLDGTDPLNGIVKISILVV